MLRFLSNYIFQNENQPNENDPTTTTTPISNSEDQQGGPTTQRDDDSKNRGKEEFMDFMEEERGEEDSDDDDWVLIGEGENKGKKQNAKVQEESVVDGVSSGENSRMQMQPVSLVAAPSEEPVKVEDDQEDESDEEDEDDGTALLWENKLIEHPSMSVYVDLATSFNTNSISVSSIYPDTSPGESVIVLEDADEEDEEEDEAMDAIEMVPSSHQVSVTPEPQEELNPSDMENNVYVANHATARQTYAAVVAGINNPIKSVDAPTVQNGRRKKGHYPCTSTNSSQMPRRTHLRSAGGNSRFVQAAAFHMISPNTPFDSIQMIQSRELQLGGDPNMTLKRKLECIASCKGTTTTSTAVVAAAAAAATAAAAAVAAATSSACGIGMVGPGVGAASATNPAAAASATNPNLINKNLKLVEVLPTAPVTSKKRQRNSNKANTTAKGHFLQESRRRQDLQKPTKHSFVNNDRRSAQQRRVQKGAAGGAAGSGK